ncbi:MAG: M23 family metallopeptidase [Clostridiales bacterium]
MGCINEFAFDQQKKSSSAKKSYLLPFFIIQLLISVILVFFLALSLDNQGNVGILARYIRDQALTPANSWLDFQEVLPVSLDMGKSEAKPCFLLPVYGLTVRDFALRDDKISSQSAILIQGSPDDPVICTADGQINQISRVDEYYEVEILHANGFISKSGGLKTVNVSQKQQLKAGDILGNLGMEPLNFQLWQNNKLQDPFIWLFPENNNAV